MRYNPLKEFIPAKDIGEMPYLNIERQPEDKGEDWAFHNRLIENLLCHYEEVGNCAVDLDGKTVYVALSGDMYDVDDMVSIDKTLREAIGKVASFDYESSKP